MKIGAARPVPPALAAVPPASKLWLPELSKQSSVNKAQ